VNRQLKEAQKHVEDTKNKLVAFEAQEKDKQDAEAKRKADILKLEAWKRDSAVGPFNNELVIELHNFFRIRFAQCEFLTRTMRSEVTSFSRPGLHRCDGTPCGPCNASNRIR
jgi:hypothetical protein